MPHSRELRRRPGPPSRRAGLLLAAGLGLVVVSTIAWRVLTAADAATSDDDAFANLPTEVLGQSEGSGLLIALADEDDPTRQAGEIVAERFEQLSPTVRRVEQPVAWFFLEDGRVAHVRADRGRFEAPPGQREPERGNLAGNVILRVFASGTPDNRPEPGVTQAEWEVLAADPVDFDIALGKLNTPGRLDIRGQTPDHRIDAVVHGMTAFLNQLGERIDNLRVERGERVTITPAPAPPPAPAARRTTPATEPPATRPDRLPTQNPAQSTTQNPTQLTTPTAETTPAESAAATLAIAAQPTGPAALEPSLQTASPAQTDSSAPAAEPAAPKIDLYLADFETAVRLVQGARELDADELVVWSRVIDNKIPSRASPAPVGLDAVRDPASLLLAAVLAAHQEAASTGPGPGASRDDEPEQPVTLTWTGPMTLRALPPGVTTPELDASDLNARFTATRRGAVRFADTASADPVDGEAGVLWYDDTNQRITLESPVGAVTLRSGASGELSGISTMVLDLPIGEARVAGAGLLRGADDGEDAPDGQRRRRSIRWTDNAAFAFAMDGERMTDRIDTASFAGGVLGLNDAGTIEAAHLRAAFVDESGSPRLSQVDAEQARTDDGAGATLDADALSVHFARGTAGEDADPTRLIALGAVRGRRDDGALIDADALNARLARDEHGDVIVTEVRAEGVDRFDDGRGRSASAAALSADVLNETAVLDAGPDGEPARIAQPGAAVTGKHIELDGPMGTLRVDGPGTFARDAGDGVSVDAAWTLAMRFDDVAGTLAARGDALATASDTTGRRDELRAHALDVTLTPRDQTPAGEDRRLLTALATARSPDKEDWASVERRQAADPADDRQGGSLVELFHLEGGRVALDNSAERVDVAGPGLLLIIDNRDDPDTTPADEPSLAGRRAQSLFEWTGSMAMERARGVVTFRDKVRVVHRRLTDAGVTTLEAERLTAYFRDLDENTGNAELDRVEAEGAVYIVDGPREVIADRLDYDARRGIAVVESRRTGAVTLFDNQRGTTQAADSLTWNLVTDEIQMVRPRSAVVPGR